MALSATFMGVLGLVCSFLPQELLQVMDAEAGRPLVVLMQVTGALYLGFAFLNWMARGVIIGGIYSRPVALGNFMHFAVVSIVLIKSLMAEPMWPFAIISLAYVVFAIWFGLVLFTHPGKQNEN